jgi:hypothetical protein
MKSIVYYCGEDFEASCGRELSAEQWLHRKIIHATELHHQLAHVDYLDRDDLRISRIGKAIQLWRDMIDEINGKHKEIE